MKILVAYDGSEWADAALKDLTRAGLDAEAEVLVMSVADVFVPPAVDDDFTSHVPEQVKRAHERARHELDQAERAFSDEAQRSGLGPAFAQYGSADAMNMGGPDDTTFVLSAAAIGAMIGAGDEPGGATLSWAPDHVLVATSGDLGVSIGFIVPHPPKDPTAAPAGPARFPFFTVWRRNSPTEPWRYVAE